MPARRAGACEACCDWETGAFKTNFKDISANAERGCPSCSILRDGICLFLDDEVPRDENLLVYQDWTSGSAVKRFVDVSPSAMVMVRENAKGSEADPGSWDDVQLAYDIPGNTQSGESLEWTIRQLKRCLESHTGCNSSQAWPLPKRVIDVEVFQSSKDVKIIETHGETQRYACLSHCWGSHRALCTESASYASHKNCIAWSTLPKTYQDAISASRKLNIRYLWIDSLCIIQDDIIDWQIESSQMASIYSGAFLTLAAVKSSSDSEGMFSMASFEYRARRLSQTGKNGREYIVHVRKNLFHPFLDNGEGLAQSKAPLLGRAWVFQERLLSPRILHFGSEELAWECREEAACECRGVHTDYNSVPDWFHTKVSYWKNTRGQNDLGEFDLDKEWHNLIEEYTSKALTLGKDIFPAISGIVKDMQQNRADIYIGGFWERSLLGSLGWQTKRTENSPRPCVWQAPTWSWASVRGAIEFPSTDKNSLLLAKYFNGNDAFANILEVQCVPAGLDLTGELASGHIQISSYVNAAILRYIERGSALEPRAICYEVEFLDRKIVEFMVDYDISEIGANHVAPGTVVYCLMLYFGYEPPGKPRKAVCLVLTLKDAEEPLFERIGFLRLPYDPETEKFPFGQERCTVKII